MRKKLLILGASTFAEEITEIVKETDSFELFGYVEGLDRERCKKTLGGYPILWIDEITDLINTHVSVCAVGSSKRVGFTNKAEELGLTFTNLIHPTSWIAKSAVLKEGIIINARAVIAAQTIIGKHTIINRGALIGHHVNIGNYVTIGPGANIAGKAKIGDCSYIAMGSIILNDIKIGSNSIVGAGAVVTRDVPDKVQVVGIPARVVKELE